MPSIEIISIGQKQATSFDNLPFALVSNTEIISDRDPSRFQADFDTLSGVIYHLGNPDLINNSENRVFFAYELLSRDCQDKSTFLEFTSDYRSIIEVMLNTLLSESPPHRLVFTSDWQFGPEWTKHEPAMTLPQFWKAHDSQSLLLNALYPILGD